MSAKAKRASGWLISIVVLVVAVLGLQASHAQNNAPLPSMPSSLTSALQSEPVRTVLLPDGRLLTLHDSELVLASTSAVSFKTSTQPIFLPWIQQFAEVTVVPDGRVLIWGGVDAQGHTIRRGLWFDPETGDLVPVVNPPLSPRAGGTATVLSDGQLLLAGGWSSQADGMPQSELWDPQTNDLTPVANALVPVQLGQTATLLQDGRVQLSGGFDGRGKPTATTTIYDPNTQQFSIVDAKTLVVPVNGMSQPTLMASLPKAGANDFAADGVLSLRFSEPMDPRTINDKTITLLGPGGDVPVTVAAVEDGRLAFITPKSDLYPSVHYTLFVQGVSSQRHVGLSFTAIDFSVAAETAAGSSASTTASTSKGSTVTPAAAASTGTPASGSSLPPIYVATGTSGADSITNAPPEPCGVAGHPLDMLCRSSSYMDTVNDAWYPGQDAAGNTVSGHWRLNRPDMTPQEIAYAELMLKVRGGSASTGLTGRIELIDGKPIGNIDVSIGSQHVRTDSGGRFKLTGVPAGSQTLYVDGTTADTPNHSYGQFVTNVVLRKGVVLPLPYRMYLPRILPRDVVAIPSPTTRDMVITQPDVPGLEIHIPAGTVIKDYKGKIVTQLAIVPTPVDRAPFPLTQNFPVFVSLEPGGATIQNLNPKAAQGIQVVYPNYQKLPAGTRIGFNVYNPEEGWEIYGDDRVTANGLQLAPSAGTYVHRVMPFGGGLPNPPSSHPGDPQQGKPCGAQTKPCPNDPVDLWSDTLEESQTDIQIDDIVPISLTRVFHLTSLASEARMFGGWRSSYDMYLYNSTGNYQSPMSLRLSDGNLLTFSPVALTGTAVYQWAYTGSPSKWYGAIIQAYDFEDPHCESDASCYWLTLKDGTQIEFGGEYGPAGAPTFIRDRFGNQIALTWNAGLLQQITSPSGRYIALTYNSENNIATAEDNAGRTWTYNYTTHTQASPALTWYSLDSVVYPDSSKWTFTYQTDWSSGSLGTLSTMTDRNGNPVLSNTYTQVSGGQTGQYTTYYVQSQKLADDSTYTYNRNAIGSGAQEMDVIDPEGNVKKILFDSVSGYPSSITRASGNSIAETTTYQRESTGLIDSMTDALGRTTSYTYDTMGNVLSMSITGMQGAPSSVTEHFTWTPDYNQIATYKDGLGHTTSFTYTSGCLTQIKDALGHATNIICSVTGQPLTVTDALGHKSTFGYQAYDLRTVTDALNRTTTYTSDPLGRDVAVSDAVGDVARRVYDPNNDRVDSLVDPMGNTITLQYDAMGNVKRVTLPATAAEPAGAAIVYQYDGLNRLITRTDPLNQSESWTYYPLGEVKTHTDRKGQTTSYLYDALDRLSQKNYADNSNVIATYDAGNRITELNDSLDGISEYGWNGLDELTEEQTEPLGAKTFQTVKYQYDAAGRRQSMVAGTQAQVNYTYDNADRLSKLAQGTAGVVPVFDNANRLSKLTLPNGVVQTYAYDNANELTGISYAAGATTLGNLVYTYDAAGQRNGQTGTFASDNLPTATTANSTFDANNRQSSYDGAMLQYDPDGNLTSDGTNTYVWNARNQLVQIKQGSSVLDSFTYDPVGRRQSKTISSMTTSFLYDGINPVQETQGTTVSGILEGLGVDQYFARQEPDNSNAGEYFLTDAEGSTIGLTDSTGTLIQQYHYGPYGEVNANNAGITNPYQYTGRENDGNGLYYYRARYYSPSMMRFVGEDPMGLTAGPNSYSYSLNNPVNFKDPLGLFIFWGWWCGPNWTGGHFEEYNPSHDSNYRQPVDDLDYSCMVHDKCYYKCRHSFRCQEGLRTQCFLTCDKELTLSAIYIAFEGSGTQSFMAVILAGVIGDPSRSRDEPNRGLCPECGR